MYFISKIVHQASLSSVLVKVVIFRVAGFPAFLRNNTERFLAVFTQFILICIYHNQKVDIVMIHPSCTDFPSFTCLHMFMCMCVQFYAALSHGQIHLTPITSFEIQNSCTISRIPCVGILESHPISFHSPTCLPTNIVFITSI